MERRGTTSTCRPGQSSLITFRPSFAQRRAKRFPRIPTEVTGVRSCSAIPRFGPDHTRAPRQLCGAVARGSATTRGINSERCWPRHNARQRGARRNECFCSGGRHAGPRASLAGLKGVAAGRGATGSHFFGFIPPPRGCRNGSSSRNPTPCEVWFIACQGHNPRESPGSNTTAFSAGLFFRDPFLQVPSSSACSAGAGRPCKVHAPRSPAGHAQWARPLQRRLAVTDEPPFLPAATSIVTVFSRSPSAV